MRLKFRDNAPSRSSSGARMARNTLPLCLTADYAVRKRHDLAFNPSSSAAGARPMKAVSEDYTLLGSDREVS